mgnify:CR=1 FL=1
MRGWSNPNPGPLGLILGLVLLAGLLAGCDEDTRDDAPRCQARPDRGCLCPDGTPGFFEECTVRSHGYQRCVCPETPPGEGEGEGGEGEGEGEGGEGEGALCCPGEAPLARLQHGVCEGARQVCLACTWAEPGYVKRVTGFEAQESTCDGQDNDCDGLTDEMLKDPARRLACQPVGICAAVLQCDPEQTGEVVCLLQGAQEAETCNGLDDDCDGITDEGIDAVTCGLGECRHTVRCRNGSLPECDPLAGARAEKCNGLDDDCDGETDEDLTRDCSTACGPGSQTCAAGVWSACPAVQPAPETCNDVDDDCDGQTDEEDATDCTLFFRDEDEDEAGVDGDARCLCAAATPYTATVEGDCDDADPARHPEADETCNGLDDDCDDALGPGEVDEDEDGLLDCLGDCIDDASQLVKAGACVGDADCLQVEDCAEDLSGPCTCRLPAADPLP